MIIADTSGLLAYFREVEPSHAQVVTAVDAPGREFAVSPYVLAELDYLIADRDRVAAELDVLQQFAEGAFALPKFEAEDIAAAREIIAKYRDKEIGLADASIVVLADRYKTKEILTLDRRHFDVLRPLSGGRFKLLP